MGRDATFYCKTCKQMVNLGYGSYSTWLDGARTVAEYDEQAAKTGHGDIRKNQNMRQCLAAHEGHEIGTFSGDWTYTHEGRVHVMGAYGADGPAIVGNAAEGWTTLDLDVPNV